MGGLPDLERDLAGSRAREAALTDVLAVMSRSVFDLGTVLSAVIENAVRLSEADNGSILRTEYGRVGSPSTPSVVSSFGLRDPEGYRRFSEGRVLEPDRSSMVGRVLLEGRTLQIENTASEPGYAFNQVTRTVLGVPLLLGDELVGILVVRREPPRPFTTEQIRIVETFAAQAAIAINNVRLFDETQEALERQTVISDVLKTISGSAFELQAVFRAIVRGAAELCHADGANIWRADGTAFILEAYAQTEIHPIGTRFEGGARFLGRVAESRSVVHIPDTASDPVGSADTRKIWGTRLGVAIVKDGAVLGVISLGRTQCRPFAANEISLLTTFADQAAIAIDNARLFATVRRQSEELSRFLSPQIAELITGAEGAKLLQGHRAQITVVFFDIRGFTAFAETADPEEVLGVLRTYQSAMGEIIFASQGTLEHFAGDGGMVFFNDPVPFEDHEIRAVRMAVAMRARFEALSRDWGRRGYQLGFGVGAAVGYATLGRTGFEGRYDYGAVGTVVILAARLVAQAKAGQILISQRLHVAVEKDVVAEPVEALALKGLSKPMSVVNVLRLAEADSPAANAKNLRMQS